MTKSVQKERRKSSRLFFAIALCLVGSISQAMDVKVIGNTLIMSGKVKGDEVVAVKDAFAANPNINLAILRNSPGGDAWAGYRVGEWFRDNNVTTAVSGYCISSCSRMFLGGKKRLFTDDYPSEKTYVGFHGHYNDGKLNEADVYKMGLYRWILKYSDGKADEALVERWTNIKIGSGAAWFLHPDVADKHGASAYFCEGTERGRPLSCEHLKTNAIERGVATELNRISSPDKDILPHIKRGKDFPSSGYAELNDIEKLPLASAQGIENYKKYIDGRAPKAFAISPSKYHWAWNSGNELSNELALQRCTERSNQKCILYAVDDLVVYKP